MSERTEGEARAIVRTLIDTGWVSRAVNELFPEGRDPVTLAIAAALDARTEACCRVTDNWAANQCEHCRDIAAAMIKDAIRAAFPREG